MRTWILLAIAPAFVQAQDVLPLVGQPASRVIQKLGKPVEDHSDGTWRNLTYDRPGFTSFRFRLRDPKATDSKQRNRKEEAWIHGKADKVLTDGEVFRLLSLDRKQWKDGGINAYKTHSWTFGKYWLRSMPGKDYLGSRQPISELYLLMRP